MSQYKQVNEVIVDLCFYGNIFAIQIVLILAVAFNASSLCEFLPLDRHTIGGGSAFLAVHFTLCLSPIYITG